MSHMLNRPLAISNVVALGAMLGGGHGLGMAAL